MCVLRSLMHHTCDGCGQNVTQTTYRCGLKDLMTNVFWVYRVRFVIHTRLPKRHVNAWDKGCVKQFCLISNL